MNNQLVMKESKVNPMHDSPFYSSLAFPISTIVEAIISSTADTVWASIVIMTLFAQRIHADYLSGLPGDPPWIIMWARPFSVESVLLFFQDAPNDYICSVTAREPGCCIVIPKKCMEDLVEP